MNTFWKAAIVLSAVIIAVNGLDCRSCFIGIFESCIFSSDVTCNNATQSCYKGNAQFNATRGISLHTRGCIDSDLCGTTLTGSIVGAAYTSSFTCCNTDQCNGATAVQVSATAALCAAVLSALWGSWEL